MRKSRAITFFSHGTRYLAIHQSDTYWLVYDGRHYYCMNRKTKQQGTGYTDFADAQWQYFSDLRNEMWEGLEHAEKGDW